MNANVIITDMIADDLAPEREVLAGIANVSSLQAKSASDLVGRIESADAIIAYHYVKWDRSTIGSLRQCRLLARGGVGTDNVDLAYARERGIPVINVPDYGTEEVADSAFAMFLALARGTNALNRRWQRGGGPWGYAPVKPLTRLRGRTAGIIGFGRIGQAIAMRLKAVGMDVVVYDPHISDGNEKPFGVRRVENLDDLIPTSFALFCQCPSTPETVNLIDAAALAKMPRGSFLINAGRGDVVTTSAIPEAIRSGQLAGAGIDVFAVEPPPKDDPLVVAWQNPDDPCHERVILTPHVAFYSEEGLRHIRIKTAEACRRALTGQPLRNVVN